MRKFNVAAFAIVVCATAASVAGPADAAIRCENGYQIVQGAYHATPYCQEAQLAKVAREYGMSAQAAAIRNSPNYKMQVCRLVGRDIRVQDTCIDAFPSGRGQD